MDLNKIEVFKIAQNMEQDGMDFYKKAAEWTDDENYASIFDDLVEMEAQHYKIFSDLEKKFKNDDYFESGIFTDEPKNDWDSITTEMDIFVTAKQKEEDTVKYYVWLQSIVNSPETKKILDKVIVEEKSHVEMMQNYISELSL